MLRIGASAGAIALLAACGGSETPPEQPADEAQPCDPVQPCADVQPCDDAQACAPPMGDAEPVLDTGHAWSEWQSWERLSDEPFVSEGHEAAFVEVYVAPEYVEEYRALDGEMPEGMGIVKAGYADDGGEPGELTGLTVMAKMGEDYDPENNNWYYGMLEPEGEMAMMQGPVEMCVGCHAGAEDTDYLFGEI